MHQAATEQAEAAFVARTIDQLLGGASFHSLDSGRVDSDGAERAGVLRLRRALPDRRAGPGRDGRAHRAGLPFQKRSHDRLADRPGRRSARRRAGVRAAAGDAAAAPPGGAGYGSAADALLTGCRRATLADGRRTARAAATGRRRAIHTAVELLAPLAERCGDDLERFRTELALGVEVDTWDPRADRISLLTLHAAKGLEFPVVFLVGCEDGLLPLRLPGTAAGRSPSPSTCARSAACCSSA